MRFAALLLFFVLPACGASMEDVVRTRAAHDFHCTEDDVRVQNIAGGTFKVKGCGYAETYDCVSAGSTAVGGTTMSSDYTCKPEAGD
jgi:hypothetical protein